MIDLENLKEKDMGKDVKFSIDKNAFKGPFTCHGRKTFLKHKKLSFNDFEFSYSVWKCKNCKKEYLDLEQGRRLEKFWIVKMFLEGDLITVGRTMNFDGKAYFFRFPKELSGGMKAADKVDIKLLKPDGKMFLVEIKSDG